MSLSDLMPKVDITGQIKSDIIKEIGDKNWKVRAEGLQRVQDIVAQAKFITPSLGSDLPGALKGRLTDANKNIVSWLSVVSCTHTHTHTHSLTLSLSPPSLSLPSPHRSSQLLIY